jgi:hypothetical protein
MERGGVEPPFSPREMETSMDAIRDIRRAFFADMTALEEAADRNEISPEEFTIKMWQRIAKFGEELGV